MRSDPKTERLRGLPFLRGCSDRVLADVAAAVDERAVPAGQVLTRQGETGGEAFVVVEGWAAAYRDGEPVAAIGPGEFIGEMAMPEHAPRRTTVIAKTAMQLLVIGPGTFEAQ